MITLDAALDGVRRHRRDGDIVVTTMASAKVWMQQPLAPLDFVFVPSCMGHATSLGLGLALAQPQRRVIVCNGDGSMLMNLGSLVTIAAAHPANLCVLVMDNGVYEITGAQPLPRRADIAAIARASGIQNVHEVTTIDEWQDMSHAILHGPGPVLAVLGIGAVPDRGGPRSPGPARERARAFSEALRSG